MSILITGVAGFIGSNLAKKLSMNGRTIIGIDNLSLGSLDNIIELQKNPKFIFLNCDISNFSIFLTSVKGLHKNNPITEVWHLAASSDIAAGVKDANIDLKDTFMTTFNTLQVMQKLSIDKLFFASSSAIYGDFSGEKVSEDVGPLFPISHYGAMKLSSEALISSSVEFFLEKACIFRFPNVVGIPATHGVILDFIRKLKSNPLKLQVLGNGKQKKSYMHVEDLIEAMLFIDSNTNNGNNYFNIGAQDKGILVNQIAEMVVNKIAPNAEIYYENKNKGWVGDVPSFVFSVEKLKSLGWEPKLSSHQVIKKAINEISIQEGF